MTSKSAVAKAASELNQLNKIELIEEIFESLDEGGKTYFLSSVEKPTSGKSDIAYTVGRAAKMLGVSNRTVSGWFDSGKLRGYRVEGPHEIRIPHEALAKYLTKIGNKNAIPTNDKKAKGKQIAYTSVQAAKICGVSSQTIKRWVKSGKLKGYFIAGKRIRKISASSIKSFAKKNGKKIKAAA